MAIYTPSRGGKPDGRCVCGAPATTEVQCGYDPGEYYGPNHHRNRMGGPQLDEMCEECYEEHLRRPA